MAKCKTITFRPTPAALEALAELVKVHGDRSKVINAAIEAASVLIENGLELPKRGARSTLAAAVVPAKPVRRTKTNATIAPPPNMLRRTIQKPAWKA